MKVEFERTIQLLGEDAYDVLRTKRVILFGVGGVGGWCAESLVRTGLRSLTLVDFDKISLSNINRQVVATSVNVGRSKVEEMRMRLLSICPDADIVAIDGRYDETNYTEWHLEHYDVVVDAIDSVDCKARLLYEASRVGVGVFSSMGAGRKVDTSRIEVADFRKVHGCPLARAVRHRMKKTGLFPSGTITCVFSPELYGDGGTIAPIVGTFGMRLAGEVLRGLLGLG